VVLPNETTIQCQTSFAPPPSIVDPPADSKVGFGNSAKLFSPIRLRPPKRPRRTRGQPSPKARRERVLFHCSRRAEQIMTASKALATPSRRTHLPSACPFCAMLSSGTGRYDFRTGRPGELDGCGGTARSNSVRAVLRLIRPPWPVQVFHPKPCQSGGVAPLLLSGAIATLTTR
jgi:hypothetical protein